MSPQDAGVYKLEISYEDLIDPATYNYADPVTLYFAIDPRQVKIEPKAESYEILEGRSMWDFFHGEKAIEYDVKAVNGSALPSGAVGSGRVVETVKATSQENKYEPDDEETSKRKQMPAMSLRDMRSNITIVIMEAIILIPTIRAMPLNW